MKSFALDVIAAIEPSHAKFKKYIKTSGTHFATMSLFFHLLQYVLYRFFPRTRHIAALTMSGRSALVAINTLMLKRTQLIVIWQQPVEASSGALNRVAAIS